MANFAPIDIVISILNRHKEEVERDKEEGSTYYEGKLDTYKELIEEFEGFKKLFKSYE